jgi:hypothetical protein
MCLTLPNPAWSSVSARLSNTPSQALYLLNNAFVLEQSDALAERLQQADKDRSGQINLAFQLVFSRLRNPPSWRPACSSWTTSSDLRSRRML